MQKKLIFTDAATNQVSQQQPCIGAILCQVISPNHQILPPYINLNFQIDRVIYDEKLSYQPLVPVNTLPVTLLQSRIDISRDIGPIFGYSEDTYMESAYLAIGVILKFYGCQKEYTTLDIKQLIVKEIKNQPFLKNKLRDTFFQGEHGACNNYLNRLNAGSGYLDTNEIMFHALSLALRRPVVLIYAHQKYSPFHLQVSKLNIHKYQTPAIVLGIERHLGELVYLPYIVNKDETFELETIKGRLQIIAYFSKRLPALMSSRSVLDLECIAIHSALHYFDKYVRTSDCTLVTDSRACFFLFNKRVHDHNTKLNRWCVDLLNLYPNLKL